MVAMSALDGLSHAEQLDYVRAHPEDFIGRLLIGVFSTGIYCLPTCPAKHPKPENVRFFKTEAEAQAAGLRACKRCHPDYFYRNYDPDVESLNTLVEAIRRDPASFPGLGSMTAASGIGMTKLSALFRKHYHTTPAAFLSRVRLETACKVLADPERQVIEAAFAAGYESLSAFHSNFRRAMGLSPKEYQCLGGEDSFTVVLPKPYLAWVAPKLLGRDSESIIERASGNHAVKALTVGTETVLLDLEWQAQYVHCRVECEKPLGAASMQSLHGMVVRMLGLRSNPKRFERSGMANPEIGRLIKGRHGLRIPLSTDLFEGITWAIIGQQVNLPFAYKLRRELARLCGRPSGRGLVAHPSPEAVAQLNYSDLTQRQFSRRKAEYLIDLARTMTAGGIPRDPLLAASEVEKQLLAVRGLGQWSVNYIMMRAFGYADCVPLGDTGLSTALQRFYELEKRPGAEETSTLMARFAPFRSLATYHLWMSLGEKGENAA